MTAPPRPLVCAFAAVLVAFSGCSALDGPPEPLPAFQAYAETKVEGTYDPDVVPPFGWSASGVLADLSVEDVRAFHPDDGYHVVRLAFDGAGVPALRLQGLDPGQVSLAPGRAYDVAFGTFLVIHGSFPVLRVSDADGLAFYGATLPDLPSGGAVPLLDGWTARLEPAVWGARDAGCGVRTAPLRVVVEHEGQRVRLAQGETGRLGPYAVQIRVAQDVDYSDVDCLDVALPALSVVVSRT